MRARWIVALALVVAIGAVAVSGVPAVTTADTSIVRAVALPRGTVGASVAEVVTHLGQFRWPFTAALVGGAVLLVAGAWRLAWRPLAALMLAVTVGPWIKGVVGRVRPPEELWVTCPAAGIWPDCGPSSGYPSGHSGQAAAAWMALAFVLAARWPQYRVAFLSTGIGITVLVGLSRVVLGVHSPTDVIGGWSVGLGCALLVAPLARPRAARRAPVS